MESLGTIRHAIAGGRGRAILGLVLTSPLALMFGCFAPASMLVRASRYGFVNWGDTIVLPATALSLVGVVLFVRRLMVSLRPDSTPVMRLHRQDPDELAWAYGFRFRTRRGETYQLHLLTRKGVHHWLAMHAQDGETALAEIAGAAPHAFISHADDPIEYARWRKAPDKWQGRGVSAHRGQL